MRVSIFKKCSSHKKKEEKKEKEEKERERRRVKADAHSYTHKIAAEPAGRLRL